MRATFEKSFERGQNLVRHFLFAAILCGAASLLLVPQGSVYQVILVILSTALLIGMIVCAWKLCRCPYCGKHIIAGALAATVCPACSRDLRSGRKVKKSRR